MTECTKAHLQQCRISNFFPERNPRSPDFQGKEERNWEEGKGRKGKSGEALPQNKNLPLQSDGDIIFL